MNPNGIIKRDGTIVPFDASRIEAAIRRAQEAVDQFDEDLAAELARVVVEHLGRQTASAAPHIEEVQDAVIYVLQESGNYAVATAFLRYRDARERERRRRRVEDGPQSDGLAAPHLSVVARDGRSRDWDGALLRHRLIADYGLPGKAATDVVRRVEADLAETDVTSLSAPLVMSLIDAALVRCGMASSAEKRAPLRIERRHVQDCLARPVDGCSPACALGANILFQHNLADVLPAEVLRLFGSGRLWVDGLDDPTRGSAYSAAIDGHANPWQVINQALCEAIAAQPHWRQVRLILPPLIIGHLERGAATFLEALEHLGKVAEVYLYCDGRTPLLDEWPFVSRRISIASYSEDFLLLRRLQELGLEHLSGPHLMRGGYRKRVAVKLALNAQGLEDDFPQMDHLAMGLVAAAKARQRQVVGNEVLAGADIRYAIFGLPPNSASNDYIERQVVQEGLRNGIALSRTTDLPGEACQHLGRLFAG